VTTADLTAICLELDPCVCGTCGHGNHDDCTGLYTLFSGQVVACQCLCHHQATTMTGCDTCGVGPDDECETGCTATPPEPATPATPANLTLMAVFTPEILDVIAGAILNPVESRSSTRDLPE